MDKRYQTSIEARSELDPADWEAFRNTAHGLLDDVIGFLANAEEAPWQPLPEDIRKTYALDGERSSLDALRREFSETLMPYHGGNIHPRFFGWVQGTGLASSLLSEMVVASMNANLGGRNHAAVEIERAVVNWSKTVMGFPETASGILVTGTSQATVLALSVARCKLLGKDVRAKGNQNQNLVIFAAETVHTALKKATELLGLGSENIIPVKIVDGAIDPSDLQLKIQKARAEGAVPLAIVATAGTVDAGFYDPFHAIADIAAEENIWLHIDGAFGAWTRLASAHWRALSDGIERADSLVFDFHKWPFVQYDAGMVLIRDEHDHSAAFTEHPNYLETKQDGIAGGAPWFCDYGIDLSRSNRALKIWSAVKLYGVEALGRAIDKNCELAAYFAALVDASPYLEMAIAPVSNVVLFSAKDRGEFETVAARNDALVLKMQMEGIAVFSTTKISGETVMRGAIVNHRTRAEDMRLIVDYLESELSR